MKTKAHTIYKNAEGKRVVGTSTICDQYEKVGLRYYYLWCGQNDIDPNKYRDDKAMIGSCTHEMIHCDFRGVPMDTSDYTAKQIKQAETCFLKYLLWKEKYELEPILLETPIVSEEYQYGGTPDFCGLVDGRIELIDFKTAKSIYMPHNAIQLAAYRQLLKEVHDIEVEACRIVRIGRDEDEGFEDPYIRGIDEAFEIFKRLREIYDLNKKIGKGL